MIYTIKGSLPTLNQHDSANRANKFLGAKMKKESTELVEIQMRGKQKITKPCTISFHWYISNRSDPDNIRFSCKYILDGMVKAGILPDDTQKWVMGFDGDSFIRVPKGEDKIIVEVYELD